MAAKPTAADRAKALSESVRDPTKSFWAKLVTLSPSLLVLNQPPKTPLNSIEGMKALIASMPA